ncbi:hypothetical protein KAI32_03050 [Candidatus Pacearchaeota archaeon]|nr:hypothetical protein [Candidatus Pacearchaeota archaeon]
MNKINLADFKKNYEASGNFRFLLVDILRNMTRETDLFTVIKENKIHHYVGKTALKDFFNRIPILCSDNLKFSKFVEDSEKSWRKVVDEFNKLKRKEDLENIQSFLKVLKKFLYFYVIIDFDASSADEEKLKSKKPLVYENYKKIGQLKNNLRKKVNKAVLTEGNYFIQTIKILAEKTNIKFSEIVYYKESELNDLILKLIYVSREEIKKRQEGFGVASYKNQIYYLFEEELNQILNNSSDKEEIRGDVACTAKENIIGRVKKFDLNFDNIESQIVQFIEKIKNVEEPIVLVVKATTPEMMLIFGKISAIVTDYGGMNTHAAIISREMNIPCIVGTEIASEILDDDDLVEVDTEKGIVKKVN